jgi:hypothetical protein
MVNVTQSYEKFCSWVQSDISKDRVLVNRKILSVVVWCLLLPGLITILLYFPEI